MEAGVFDFLKRGIEEILKAINRLKTEGKLIEYAKSIANTVIGFIETMMKAWVWMQRVFTGIETIMLTIRVVFWTVIVAFQKVIDTAKSAVSWVKEGVEKTDSNRCYWFWENLYHGSYYSRNTEAYAGYFS